MSATLSQEIYMPPATQPSDHDWTAIILALAAVLGGLVAITKNVAKLRGVVAGFFGGLWAVLTFPLSLTKTLDELTRAIQGLHALHGDVANLSAFTAQKVQLLFEGTSAPMFECKLNGDAVWTNHAIQEIFGLPPEQMLGNGWLNGLHPDDIEPTNRRWRETIQQWIPYRARYRVINAQTGKVQLCEATATMIRTPAGVPLGIIGRLVVLDGDVK